METVEVLNNRLKDIYGRFHDTNEALFRIVWSDEQFEWRHGTYCKYDEHNNLLGEEIATRWVPKYRQWITHKWVLEICMTVPTVNTELTTKFSYEPLWAFDNEPEWEFISHLIHTVRKQAAKAVGAKYKEPEEQLNTPEAIEGRIKKIEKELYGNETKVGDALAFDSAVGYGIRKRSDK